MERKRILVGVDDFKSIIDSNGYYLDKTLYIKQLLNLNFSHFYSINLEQT